MEWCKMAIDILIEAHGKEECLYNKNTTHNKHSRQRTLENICNALTDINLLKV